MDYEIARRIRAQRGAAATSGWWPLPGYGQEADRARTREAGFTHHLVKPVDFADLKRVLASLATRHAA